MKKFATLVASAILAAPFVAVAAPNSTVAAKTKSYKFSLISVKAYKSKAYHVKTGSPTYYIGTGGATNSYVTMTAKGKLKAKKTYSVFRTMKARSLATKKARTFYYVKGHGWVPTVKLVKGAYASPAK